ncbi:MAG: glycosyl hydrolase 108 family protein [Vicinamibacterales bacterium]
MKANYQECFSHVIGSEGGFQCDPQDKGNWTGCVCYSGVNKGTNWGISACAYPDLDIKNLKQEDAEEIYHADYWNKCWGDDLPYGVDLCTFDGGVNSGVSRGVKWLQQAVGVAQDGIMGPDTMAATEAADDHKTVDRMCDARLAYLKGLSTWDTYGKGWSNRIADVRATAHKMVDEHEGEALPTEQVVTVVIHAPSGVRVDVQVVEDD